MHLRKRHLFFSLVLVSSFIAAVVSAIDSSITKEFGKYYSVEQTSWIFGCSTFIVGIIITFLICLFFSIPVKHKSIGSTLIDPSFEHLRWIQKQEIKFHVFAGFGNAIATVGYFYVLSLLVDPSAVMPFKQIVIPLLLLSECFVEKNTPTMIEIQSTIIVMFGAILGSITLSGTISLESLIIMLVIVNPGIALLSIYQRKLMLMKIKEKHNDSLNIKFWNLIFTLFFILFLLSVVDIVQGTSYIIESFSASLQFFWIIALSMTITLFSAVTYIRALGIGKASIAQAIKSSTILFAIPITFVLSFFISIPISTNPTLWLIRIIGFILVILGVVTLAITEVKAFIFIRVKSAIKASSLLSDIIKIKGIETASLTFEGKYTIVASVRIRTLLKGYTQILKKIGQISGIEEFRWISVLKEWEKI